MSTATPLPSLETSQLWIKAVALADKARAFSLTLPYQEGYAMADPVVRNGLLLSSDIAMAVGKGEDDAFDYRYARGHLFTLKSLVLLAKKNNLGQKAEALLAGIESYEALLDDKIKALDADKLAKEKEAARDTGKSKK